MSNRKKARIKMLKEKRAERDKNNWKKTQYKEMSQKGLLGNKELQNYTMMYESLKEYRKDFPAPYENPTRINYNEIKKLYSSLELKL